jgi:cysteate synthase
MRLHLVQNEPFAVMTHAWLTGGRELPAIDEGNAKKNISLLHSRVLSNRKPPYAIAGGVFDALTDTRGRMYGVSNAEAETAGRLFESIEGIDLDPAAEVALAGLIRAARAGNVPPADTVLFNATGGGSGRLAAEGRAHRVEPDFTFVGQDTDKPADIEKILSGRRPRRAS